MAAKVFNPVGSVVMDEDVELSCEIGTCIETKEDLEYDDLCTLEGLLSYFKHDTALDEEIAYLKEQCLLNNITQLEEVIAKLKGYESRWEAISKGGHDVFKGADA